MCDNAASRLRCRQHLFTHLPQALGGLIAAGMHVGAHTARHGSVGAGWRGEAPDHIIEEFLTNPKGLRGGATVARLLLRCRRRFERRLIQPAPDHLADQNAQWC